MADTLTPKQEKFMLALMSSANITEASKKAGISRTTGNRYIKDITFRKYYRQYRSDLMQQATGQLQKASTEAVNVLRQIMNDPEASEFARVQSAQTILNYGYRSHELENVLEVVEDLEAKFSER